MIMQMRQSLDVKGNKPIEFEDGEKQKHKDGEDCDVGTTLSQCLKKHLIAMEEYLTRMEAAMMNKGPGVMKTGFRPGGNPSRSPWSSWCLANS